MGLGFRAEGMGFIAVIMNILTNSAGGDELLSLHTLFRSFEGSHSTARIYEQRNKLVV